MALGIGTRRKAQSGGNTGHGPLFSRTDIPGCSDIISELYRHALRARCDEFDDFTGSALNTAFWTIKDVSASGTPTQALVNPSTGPGEWNGAFDSTNEAQVIGLFTNDVLWIDSTKGPYFECRVKVSGVAANTRFVFGLASAYNSTFDSATRNIWFRLEGASTTLYVESDDNTTDTDDQTTGLAVTADTYVTLTIDARDLGTIRYYVDGASVGTTSASAMSGFLQPVLFAQKASGTSTIGFTVDYVRMSVNRL